MIPKPKLKYANTVDEIINAFRPYPLETEEELKEFYLDGTMEFRTGKKTVLPIEDIKMDCKMPSNRNAFLLMGHRGCGKSTELNKMAIELRQDGYFVYTVECARDLDMQNPTYSDLMILFGEALLKIAESCGCKPSADIENQILSFWNSEINYYREITNDESLALEAGTSIETPRFFSVLLNLYARLKGDLKHSHTQRETYRQKISNRAGEWTLILNRLAVDITENLDGRQPVIIFEDLDKIDPLKAWSIFHDYASTLTDVSIPIIYTFPIALAYEKKSGALDGYFKRKTIPVIKLETVDGQEFKEGVETLLDILAKRVKLELFEENVLPEMIKKTGGSLRQLFSAVNASAIQAVRRGEEKVSALDAKNALDEISIELQRRIYGNDYKELRDMMEKNIPIQNKDGLLDLMQGNIVLEYQNGERWHSVHPLIREFLIRNNLGTE